MVLVLLDSRIVVAPMAGGPTTAALVTAAARSGAIGFLAAGYKQPSAVSDEVEQMRAIPERVPKERHDLRPRQ